MLKPEENNDDKKDDKQDKKEDKKDDKKEDTSKKEQNTNNNDTTNNPKTGESSNIYAWIVTFILSGLTLIGTVIYRIKNASK